MISGKRDVDGLAEERGANRTKAVAVLKERSMRMSSGGPDNGSMDWSSKLRLSPDYDRSDEVRLRQKSKPLRFF